MSRYLDPKADIVFKRIFGEHKDLLQSFLNALLPLPEDGQIVSLEYLTPEQTPQIPAFKSTIVDVRCTDQHGRVFIVEMQMQWIESFKQRLLFNASNAYVRQLAPGEDYKLLKPVYGLGLLNCEFDRDNPDWYHYYQMINVQNPQRTIEDLQLVFIELPKIQTLSKRDKKLKILWLRFMTEINKQTLEVPKEFLEVPEIKEAVRLTEESAYTPGELLTYDKYWDEVSVQKGLWADSFEKGETKGEAKGLAKGLAKGKIEEKFEIAKKMLAAKLDIKTIMEVTGLSEKEITQ